MTSYVFQLAWPLVVDAAGPLDRDAVRAVVERTFRAALPAYPRSELGPGWTRTTLEAALELALADGIGGWAALFDWSSSEGGGGGPVSAGFYCCDDHSLLPSREPDAHASVERVVRAVDDLHALLGELAALVVELEAETRDLPLDARVTRTAAIVLPLVIARTQAEDAWYATFATLVTVCLEGMGLDRGEVAPLVDDVTCGRFESWVAPDEDQASEVARDLGTRIGGALATERDDATERWAAVRGQLASPPPPAWRVPLAWDGHLRFVEGPERVRDASRADAMRAALEACRDDAKRGAPLDVARLLAWQSRVLGRHAALRTTDAFAKGGRERYAARADLPTLLDSWLREAEDARVPVAVRAARVYLDVCFTHPFEDGNARAARLAMDFVLTREGLALRAVSPVVALARAPDDAAGAAALARLVALLAAPR